MPRRKWPYNSSDLVWKTLAAVGQKVLEPSPKRVKQPAENKREGFFRIERETPKNSAFISLKTEEPREEKSTKA